MTSPPRSSLHARIRQQSSADSRENHGGAPPRCANVQKRRATERRRKNGRRRSNRLSSRRLALARPFDPVINDFEERSHLRLFELDALALSRGTPLPFASAATWSEGSEPPSGQSMRERTPRSHGRGLCKTRASNVDTASAEPGATRQGQSRLGGEAAAGPNRPPWQGEPDKPLHHPRDCRPPRRARRASLALHSSARSPRRSSSSRSSSTLRRRRLRVNRRGSDARL
jgi:hypothetical protein